MKYEFGTAIGNEFHVIASADCERDAQAELTARQIGDSPEDYDLTNLDGEPLEFLYIRRNGDVVWGVSI